MRGRYRQLKVAILANTLFTEGGDWRSIYLYGRQLETAGEKIALVAPGGKRGWRQTVAAFAFAPRVLVNGMGTLRLPLVLALSLLRKDTRIYLHETSYELDGLQRQSPRAYKLIAKLLRERPLLCVSQQAEALYKERFGARRTHVVYEYPGADTVAATLEPGKTHIVMVGSINRRKGAELFSKAADLAAERHPDWRFHWVGGLATMDAIYQSPRVTWHGWSWTPRELVGQCGAFLLTSVDDPCPLAALEALFLGKRCVAYTGTGTAEIIAGLPGCAVYAQHTPEAALEALERALGTEADPAAITAAATRTAGREAFVKNMEAALSA
jgi:glycosyltransferase involved in cell wall biosynthesis